MLMVSSSDCALPGNMQSPERAYLVNSTSTDHALIGALPVDRAAERAGRLGLLGTSPTPSEGWIPRCATTRVGLAIAAHIPTVASPLTDARVSERHADVIDLVLAASRTCDPGGHVVRGTHDPRAVYLRLPQQLRMRAPTPTIAHERHYLNSRFVP